MTTDPQPSPTSRPPPLDPDLPPGWTPELGPILLLDNRPSAPHQHGCTSLRCQGRTWACTAPRCSAMPVQSSCHVCSPPPPMKHTPTRLLRSVN
jgi:hypothetical protein